LKFWGVTAKQASPSWPSVTRDLRRWLAMTDGDLRCLCLVDRASSQVWPLSPSEIISYKTLEKCVDNHVKGKGRWTGMGLHRGTPYRPCPASPTIAPRRQGSIPMSRSCDKCKQVPLKASPSHIGIGPSQFWLLRRLGIHPYLFL
jgi:hypothetical protein